MKEEVSDDTIAEELDLKDPVRNKCRDLLYNAMKKRKMDGRGAKLYFIYYCHRKNYCQKI